MASESVPLPAASRLRLLVLPAVGLALFTAAIWAIHRELVEWRLDQISAAIGRLGWGSIAASVAAAIAGYAILSLYDVLALRYLGRRLPLARAALAGFVGYAFSHTIGFALITGGAVRYRLYSAWGLSATDIATVVGFNSVSLWVGIAVVLSVAGLVSPAELAAMTGIPSAAIIALAALLVALLAAYAASSRLLGRSIAVRRWQVTLPSPSLAAVQILLAGIDWLLAALCLWVLLPDSMAVGLPAFAGLFVAASLLGVASNVPAGLGVFEAAILMALPDGAHQPGVAAALLGYRLIYYVLPMLVASGLFAWHQLTAARHLVRDRLGAATRAANLVVPSLLAVLVFIGGIVLLASGATPASAERMEWLVPLAPLALIEISHFLGSLSGLGLLLLALGLRRRLDAAWLATVALLSLGIVASLTKGIDWEEALYLGAVLVVLAPCRAAFYRHSALLTQPLAPGWLAAVAAVVLATTWLGFFSYRYIQYDRDLWWQFLAEADAPRFLRAGAAVAILTAMIAALQLLRFARPDARRLGDEGDERRALAIVETADRPSSSAWLAALGDKRFLFSDSGHTFMMYGVQGRSWVALGAPVGRADERLELVWRFRELCDAWGGRPVFYEIGPEVMPDLVELGLTFLKVGEQAFVELAGFGVEGGDRRGLRYTLRKARKEGSTFEVLAAAQVPSVLDRLEAISDDWLRSKNAREKGFSLGCFGRDYVARFSVAVIRRDGEIVAFANLWPTHDRNELSIDLMRYASHAPRDVMEHLFIELMLWGRAEGYACFDLGMAPLAGLEDRKLAPLWSRAAALIYKYGEDYYNFEGLRKYKEKFKPRWEPRYIAAPGGLALPAILADVTVLIGGGVGAVVGRPPPAGVPLGIAAARP